MGVVTLGMQDELPPMRSTNSAKPNQASFPRLALAFRLAGFLLLLCGRFSSAQDVPIVSGALGFFDSTNTGVNFFQPVAAPVIVAPLGKHFLAESRFDLRGFFAPQNGNSGPYQGTYIRSTQYLQLDYLASKKVTFTAWPLPHSFRHLQRTSFSHLDPEVAGLSAHFSHWHAHHWLQ